MAGGPANDRTGPVLAQVLVIILVLGLGIVLKVAVGLPEAGAHVIEPDGGVGGTAPANVPVWPYLIFLAFYVIVSLKAWALVQAFTAFATRFLAPGDTRSVRIGVFLVGLAFITLIVGPPTATTTVMVIVCLLGGVPPLAISLSTIALTTRRDQLQEQCEAQEDLQETVPQDIEGDRKSTSDVPSKENRIVF